MLEALVKRGMSLDTFTCVGHSLGAHICGLIAETFKTGTLGIVAVLVALDPAGMAYRDVQDSWVTDIYRLRRGSARYTTVIHTGAFALGWEERLGDADFYPNFGSLQPCCNIPGIPNACTKFSKLQMVLHSIGSMFSIFFYFCQDVVLISLRSNYIGNH